jgi:valyl-tRNA synthetase
MTMMAGYFTGEMPFKDVYIHGLVRDENGKKMSKSANNGINPQLLISKYGADALRYTLIREVAGAGQDISLQYDRTTDESESVEASRNFANKLWNASRFVLMHLEGKTPQELGKPSVESLELSDRWILSRFYQIVQQTSQLIETYALGEAAKGLYEFSRGDFCDWYIELVKSRLYPQADPQSRQVAQQVLAYVLDGILKLLHPFMPYLTEEVWQTLSQGGGKSLALQPYPTVEGILINPNLESEFDLLIGAIRTIRNLRAEAEIKPGLKVPVILQTENSSEEEILQKGKSYIQELAKVETLTITPTLTETNEKAIASVVGTIQVLIPLSGIIDIAAFKTKLEKKYQTLVTKIESLTGRLNNPKFVNKAPVEIVESVKTELTQAQIQAQILQERLQRL